MSDITFATFEIRTRYVGPTDTRGSRIIATGHGKQVSSSFDYAASDPHKAAVVALAINLGYGTGATQIAVANPRWIRDTRSGRGSIYHVDVRLNK